MSPRAMAYLHIEHGVPRRNIQEMTACNFIIIVFLSSIRIFWEMVRMSPYWISCYHLKDIPPNMGIMNRIMIPLVLPSWTVNVYWRMGVSLFRVFVKRGFSPPKNHSAKAVIIYTPPPQWNDQSWGNEKGRNIINTLMSFTADLRPFPPQNQQSHHLKPRFAHLAEQQLLMAN